MKITKKWMDMAHIYCSFVPNEPCYDFSPKSAEQMFLCESTGNPKLNLMDKNSEGKFNGYLVGKHWMDATIKMWRKDINDGLLNRKELETDFPEWFLTKIKI